MGAVYIAKWIGFTGAVAQICVIVALFSAQSLLRSLFSFQLLFMLSVNDFAVGLAYASSGFAIERDGSSPICQIQGFALNYFTLCSTIWHASVAYTLLQVFQSASVFELHHVRSRVSFSWYFFLCQILPIVPSVIPYIFNAYGHAGLWCWVKRTQEDRFLMRLFSWYLWAWIVVLYCIVTYYFIYKKVMRFYRLQCGEVIPSAQFRQIEASLRTWRILRWYPLIQILAMLVGTTDRAYSAFDNTPPTWLTLAFAATAPCRPVADAVIFVQNPMVRQHIMSRVCDFWNARHQHSLHQTLMDSPRDTTGMHQIKWQSAAKNRNDSRPFASSDRKYYNTSSLTRTNVPVGNSNRDLKTTENAFTVRSSDITWEHLKGASPESADIWKEPQIGNVEMKMHTSST